MAERPPQNIIEIRDFQGLYVSADPHDLEPGQATVQVNVMSNNPGKMSTRYGWRKCVFEGE